MVLFTVCERFLFIPLLLSCFHSPSTPLFFFSFLILLVPFFSLRFFFLSTCLFCSSRAEFYHPEQRIYFLFDKLTSTEFVMTLCNSLLWIRHKALGQDSLRKSILYITCVSFQFCCTMAGDNSLESAICEKRCQHWKKLYLVTPHDVGGRYYWLSL